MFFLMATKLRANTDPTISLNDPPEACCGGSHVFGKSGCLTSLFTVTTKKKPRNKAALTSIFVANRKENEVNKKTFLGEF